MTENQESPRQSPAVDHSVGGAEITIDSDATVLDGEDLSTVATVFTSTSSGGRDSGSDTNARFSAASLQHTFSRRQSSELAEEAEHQKLKPSEYMKSKRISQRVLPVTRLRFSALELVGRDKEMNLLETSLNRVVEAPGSRELVFISGLSGTGKTALATSLEKSVKESGLFVTGKFDLYLRDEPYSGIAQACREICGRIMLLRDRSDDSFAEIQKELVDKLGSENLCLLINIIPELAEIVGDDYIKDVEMNKDQQGSEEARARLHYAFRILIRIVSISFEPLVILLDDIQWSDAATMDLLQVLISDRDNPSLMMIVAYRSNEVDEAHPLTPLIRTMRDTSERDEFQITEIEIGDLNTTQINELIMLLLSIDDPEKTLGLADVCLKRTHGNVFSLLVFLEMIQAEGLLEYNLGKFQWTWDEQKILAATAATSNVVDLMRQKIEKLPASVGQRLSIAACLGSSFEPEILSTVWGIISERQGSEEEDNIVSFLELAEQEGFLEKEQGKTAYRWIHDKVQEAAISSVPSLELQNVKTRVGTILIDKLDGDEFDSYIFTIVSLLHEGTAPGNESERVRLAELSLQAAEKASLQSAFDSARKYSAIGVEALPADSWSSHYKLTLDLYSTAAEAAGYFGDMEQLDLYYDAVTKQKDRPLFDKLRVYHVMISCLGGSLGRPQESVDIIVDILSQLGLKLPKRKGSTLVATLAGILKTKRRLSSLQPEDITSLPMMTEAVHLEMMRLLDQLFVVAYLAESDLLPLSIFARLRLTLENGLSDYAAPALASLGMLLVTLGDFALASKTADFARLAMDIVKCKNTDCRAEYWLFWVLSWRTEQIASMTARYFNSYECALSVGDNEIACWHIAQYIVAGFQTGKQLGVVEADCKIYLKQMIEFKRETVHADISIYCEMMQNLMGQNDGDPTKLKSEERFLSHSDQTVLGVYFSCLCILFMYFGEYEEGAKLAVERGDTYAKVCPGHFWIMNETFARGMILYAAARSGKRLYMKHAKKVHKTIKSWAQQGNPNVLHYDLLFDAELAALNGKLDMAEGLYKKAIVSATRQGLIHERAFASERYGEFLLNERNDPEEAKYNLSDAIRLYDEWGANRKVSMLREKHHKLWQKPTHIVLSNAS